MSHFFCHFDLYIRRGGRLDKGKTDSPTESLKVVHTVGSRLFGGPSVVCFGFWWRERYIMGQDYGIEEIYKSFAIFGLPRIHKNSVDESIDDKIVISFLSSGFSFIDFGFCNLQKYFKTSCRKDDVSG